MRNDTTFNQSKNPKTLLSKKIKEKFVLTKITTIEELVAFNKFSHFNQLEQPMQEFYDQFQEFPIVTTYSFIRDYKLIQTLLIDPHKTSWTPSLVQKSSALVLRIQRFRLKYYLCLKLNNGAAYPYSTINNALEEILVFLTNKKVHTTFLSTGSAYNFTPESTLSVITSELRQAEKRLRRLLEPLKDFALDFN